MVGAFAEPPLDDRAFIVDVDGVQRIVEDIVGRERRLRDFPCDVPQLSKNVGFATTA